MLRLGRFRSRQGTAAVQVRRLLPSGSFLFRSVNVENIPHRFGVVKESTSPPSRFSRYYKTRFIETRYLDILRHVVTQLLSPCQLEGTGHIPLPTPDDGLTLPQPHRPVKSLILQHIEIPVSRYSTGSVSLGNPLKGVSSDWSLKFILRYRCVIIFRF